MLSTSTTFTRLPEPEKRRIRDRMMEERARNLFFISMLDLHPERMEVSPCGSMDILTYHGMAMLVLGDGSDAERSRLAGHIMQARPHAVAGSPALVRALGRMSSGYFPVSRRMMDVDREGFIAAGHDDGATILRTPGDFMSMLSLLERTGMLPDGYDASEKEEMAYGYASRPFPFEAVGIRRDGRLVSAAYTSSESRTCAMIVGVATDPGWRRQGLARKAVSELVDVLLFEDGLSFVALSCTSPESHALYRSLGFADAGELAYLKASPDDIPQSPDLV